MISDAMLQQAAEELATAINESLPDPKECVFQFSPKFERKMKRITRRANHPILYRNLRMAASVLLVFLIGFGSILTVSTEARTFVFGWMRVRYQSMYEYFFEGEVENPENVVYYPKWLPEDCEFETSYDTLSGKVYIYSTPRDSLVQFTYISQSNTGKLYMDGVDAEQKEVMINGGEGTLYISHNESVTSNLVWMNKSRTVLFSISGDYDEDVLIKIAENIAEK